MSKRLSVLLVPALWVTASVAHAATGHYLNADTPVGTKTIKPPDTTTFVTNSSAGPVVGVPQSSYSSSASASSETGIFRGDLQATFGQNSGTAMSNWKVGAGINEPLHLTGIATGLRATLSVAASGVLKSALARSFPIHATLKVGECQMYVTFTISTALVPTPPEAVANCPPSKGTATFANGVLTVDYPFKTDTQLIAGVEADYTFGMSAFVGSIEMAADARLYVAPVPEGQIVAGSPNFLAAAADGGAPAADGGAPADDAGSFEDASAPSSDGGPSVPPGGGGNDCAMHPAAAPSSAGSAFAALALMGWIRRRRARGGVQSSTG